MVGYHGSRVVYMVFPETQDLFYKFIMDKEGKATKSEVVTYMQNLKEAKYRISRDTTLKLIEEMNSLGFIVISKPERSGFPHYLSINYKSVFIQINESVKVIGRLILMSEEPFKRITDLFNEHQSTHGGESQNDCHDCEMISGLVVTFFREWEIFINRGLDFLLYRTTIHMTDPNMQWNLYSAIIAQKIKFFAMLYDSPLHGHSEAYFDVLKEEAIGYAKNSISYLGYVGKEQIAYAKENGMPIDALIKQSQEMLNIYEEDILKPTRKIKK